MALEVNEPTHDLFFGKTANFLCEIVDFSGDRATGTPGRDKVLSLIGDMRTPA